MFEPVSESPSGARSGNVPWGRTARRVEWAHLPPAVRREVERRVGTTVVSATSQGGGFTPGFASVLTDESGVRHFVKAASVRAQRPIAQAYRQEARMLAALPEAAPAPALLWTTEVADWVVLATAYVDARPPRRPWQTADLEPALAMLARIPTDVPPPPHLQLERAEAEFADWPALWAGVAELEPTRPHLDDAAELAARFADVVRGEGLVHTDVRDDNLLMTTDGRVLLCDWNWPCVGAAWLDSLFLLIGARGDGLDVERIVARHPLLGAVPTDDLDVVLALAAGYFLERSGQPTPSTSPYLRHVQRWQGEVCWDWLAERRGWT